MDQRARERGIVAASGCRASKNVCAASAHPPASLWRRLGASAIVPVPSRPASPTLHILVRARLCLAGAFALTALAGHGCADDGGAGLLAPGDASGNTEPTWELCRPFIPVCTSTSEAALCNQAGDGYSEVTACAHGEYCFEASGQCSPPLCQPTDLVCQSAFATTRCRSDGSGWEPIQTCAKDSYCTQGFCVPSECLGAVLLVIDRSASMRPHWESVQASIEAVVRGNPQSRFGVIGFPVGAGCDVDGRAGVAVLTENSKEIASWLRDEDPTTVGRTPLLSAMQAVEANAEAIFGGHPGTVIVLSDGEDTCSYRSIDDDAERRGAIAHDLAAFTGSLRNAHSVNTYVIGYLFGDDPVELDAVAAAGGTEYAAHIPVGNEEQLTNAFKGIVTDFKDCFH